MSIQAWFVQSVAIPVWGAAVAAGGAFFGAWQGSDAKAASVAAGLAFFGALGAGQTARRAATARTTAKAPAAQAVHVHLNLAPATSTDDALRIAQAVRDGLAAPQAAA